jgi:hypothetical protein
MGLEDQYSLDRPSAAHWLSSVRPSAAFWLRHAATFGFCVAARVPFVLCGQWYRLRVGIATA